MLTCTLVQNPLGQINMRDTRVEEVEHISDSDSDGGHGDEERSSEPTLGIFPNHVHQVRMRTPTVTEVTETMRGRRSQLSAFSPTMSTR